MSLNQYLLEKSIETCQLVSVEKYTYVQARDYLKTKYLNSRGFSECTLQTHHVDSSLKRRGNDCFQFVLTWNPRDVFVGYRKKML